MRTARNQIEVSRVLFGSTHRYGFGKGDNYAYEPGVVGQWAGLVATMASRHLPYCVAAHGNKRIRHEVRAVFIAWRRGRPVGLLARTWCGQNQITAELYDGDRGWRRCCRKCPMFREGKYIEERDWHGQER